MKLGLRLLLGFFLISGLAAFFVLRVFVLEVRPSVREVMEDMLVDTANVLAELARDDVMRLPPGGTLEGTRFASSVRNYAARPINATIWGLDKRSADYRVYVTDTAGRVVFDSGVGSNVGQDYSRWRDVALTLDGRYGARATREVVTDARTSVLYVAAPIRNSERVVGVLTVAKAVSTVQPFVDRAERKILVSGAWLLGLSLVIGVLVTGWIVWSVRRLRRYAQQVQFGERLAAPEVPGELGELAKAMQAMRERLDGHAHLEQTVRALTHELKSPMTAIAGAAELLHDDLPSDDRKRFAIEIRDQVARQRTLVERLLELAKLEHRDSLEHAMPFDLVACVEAAVAAIGPLFRQRGVRMRWTRQEDTAVVGESELLRVAMTNLLENAVEFAPRGSEIELSVGRIAQGRVRISIRDFGPGVDQYALPRLGQRFFSTPRPAAPGEVPRKGSGLGLAIVREIVTLHHGELRFANADPGLQVDVEFDPHG